MEQTLLSDDLAARLGDLFTRAYASAAAYVFDARPFRVPADAQVLATLDALRADDRRHAAQLAGLLQLFDRVPEAGVFPYWYRDVNYLTVPYLAGFVVESLEEDLRRCDATMDATPAELRVVHTALRALRRERAAHLEALRPVAEAAREREARQYADAIAARDEVRAKRLAQEKVAAEAARQAARAAKAVQEQAAADPAAGLPDPDEPGISAKEKARRRVMRMRAEKGGAPPPTTAPGGDAAAGLPDPDEPGISAKEKARRRVMRMRAEKGGAPPPTTAPGGDAAAGLPDPDEPGISAKEKARRKVMRIRARRGQAP